MIPHMKRYRVCVGYTIVKAKIRQMFFDEVWASSKEHAWMQFDTVTLRHGKPVVEEIHESTI